MLNYIYLFFLLVNIKSIFFFLNKDKYFINLCELKKTHFIMENCLFENVEITIYFYSFLKKSKIKKIKNKISYSF